MIWYSWKRAGYRQYCVLPLECPQFSNCSEVQRVHGRGGVIRDVIVVRCVCAPHVLLPSSVPQHDLAPFQSDHSRLLASIVHNDSSVACCSCGRRSEVSRRLRKAVRYFLRLQLLDVARMWKGESAYPSVIY
jgi:hypothetical protein